MPIWALPQGLSLDQVEFGLARLLCVLGEFFAAREDEIDEQLLDDGPFERLETVEAKGLTEVTFATLGEILDLGSYDELVDRFELRGPATDDEAGLYRLPPDFRDAVATIDDVDSVARRWAATDELARDEWDVADTALVLREVADLARRARDEGRDLWYWWSL